VCLFQDKTLEVVFDDNVSLFFFYIEPFYFNAKELHMKTGPHHFKWSVYYIRNDTNHFKTQIYL